MSAHPNGVPKSTVTVRGSTSRPSTIPTAGSHASTLAEARAPASAA